MSCVDCDLVKSELDFLNLIGNKVAESDNKYMAILFWQYLILNGNSLQDYIDVIENFEFKTVLKKYPEFGDYVQFLDKLREYYLYYLMNVIRVDMDDKKTIELDKGEFDTATTNNTSIISKYASTLGEKNSYIIKKDGHIYRMLEDGASSKVEDGNTFLICNPYSITELIYALATLAGTNNRLIIGTFGVVEKAGTIGCINVNDFMSVIDLLIANKDDKSNIIYNKWERDGIVCESISLNTMSLHEVMQIGRLMTEYQKNLLKTIN